MEPTTAVGSRRAELEDILEHQRIRALYQPIVELDTGEIVGYEALARGPHGSPLEMPEALFDEATRAGRLAALDMACRSVALEGALAAGLTAPQALFINVEPSALEAGEPLLPQELDHGDLRAVVEFTERALTARPAETLNAVRWLRERGCGLALDDVGADERSLALLPLLTPDVTKLDKQLVQERRPSTSTAHAVNAVAAHVERTGSALLVEGIETEEHLFRARAMGATLGQGWLFGRPRAGLEPTAPGDRDLFVGRQADAGYLHRTPFELVADDRLLRRGDKRLLLALSRQLEAEAQALGREAIVLATFQHAKFFTARSRETYVALARHAAFVGVLGLEIHERPAPGVRGARLEPDDALRDEWDVVVISPHFAAAFVAKDLGDTGSEYDRRFDFYLTYDRELVAQAARSLMARIAPGLR